jgi:hypothetical protein
MTCIEEEFVVYRLCTDLAGSTNMSNPRVIVSETNLESNNFGNDTLRLCLCFPNLVNEGWSICFQTKHLFVNTVRRHLCQLAPTLIERPCSRLPMWSCKSLGQPHENSSNPVVVPCKAHWMTCLLGITTKTIVHNRRSIE